MDSEDQWMRQMHGDEVFFLFYSHNSTTELVRLETVSLSTSC